MDLLFLVVYTLVLAVLALFGLHGLVMLWHYRRLAPSDPALPPVSDGALPVVTVQLPIYNELHVAERLVEAVCRLDYSCERLEIQVLDDSTDETRELLATLVERKRRDGLRIEHVVRTERDGFKAGALRDGLARAAGELIAIFDADFLPRPDFLRATVPHLVADERLGMVQARWEHLNPDYSLLTRVQAMALDTHFAMEQQVRNRADLFINFNGTAGVWRRTCIVDAGDWQADTLTEDLDLSYRAQLRGWRFLYLNDVAVPAELPAEIHGLKSQQFRWTKGAIETARKHLGALWRSRQPLRVKVQATGHLTSNLVYPFVLAAALFSVPFVVLKNTRPELAGGFRFLALSGLLSVVAFLFHAAAQRDIHAHWRRRLFLFPLFIAGTMGLAVNNTRAVLQALAGRRSEFRRTPKYAIVGTAGEWRRSRYRQARAGAGTLLEILLAIYFLLGIGISVYYGELAMIPYQLLLVAGFGAAGILSLKHEG